MWQTIIILQENKVIFLSYLHFNSNVLQHFSSSTGNFNACRGCLGKERLCLSKIEPSLGLKKKKKTSHTVSNTYLCFTFWPPSIQLYYRWWGHRENTRLWLCICKRDIPKLKLLFYYITRVILSRPEKLINKTIREGDKQRFLKPCDRLEKKQN